MTNRVSRPGTARRDPRNADNGWPLPPEPYTQGGWQRRVGLELEFAGLSVAETAALLHRRFDAKIAVRSRHDVSASVPDVGEAEIALDTRHAIHKPKDSALVADLRDLVGDAAGIVVPTEITAPPVEIDRAGILDQISDTLRKAGARGTRAAPTNAFAMQLNVEAAAIDAQATLAILRSFLVLEDWLRDEIDVDNMRSALGFEHRFPVDYQLNVLDPAYAPSVDQLIDDYLVANPTRNRPLDLLPLLAEIDEARIRAILPAEKVKPRPAYHYRLPDCRIDDADWSPRREWERWLAVERLAAKPQRLEAALRERRALLDTGLPTFFSSAALTEASAALAKSL